MNSLQKDMGDKLDRLAKSYVRENGGTYQHALKEVMDSHPGMQAGWDRGRVLVKTYDVMGELEKVMLVAQSDRAWVMKRAAAVVDHHARLRSDQGRIPPVSGVLGYPQALQDIRAANPDLAQAEETGFIASDNWALLALLDPGVSSQVKNKGIEPATVKGVYRSSERSHVSYSNNGNEYRRYVL